MKFFQFHKPPPPRRRRRKKSHKWIDRAEAEVDKMPSLDNLEEDIVIKAAILCTAGHYTFKLSDFKWESVEKAVSVQNIIWVIEVLQKQYPRYLQYARWVAIKEGVDLIEGKRKRYRKKENEEHRFIALEIAPPPAMGKLMQEEWDRHFAGYRRWKQVSYANSRLAQFLRELNSTLESENKYKDQPLDKPARTIPIDIDGKGTIVMMTPDTHAMWNMLIKQETRPDESTSEDDPSP